MTQPAESALFEQIGHAGEGSTGQNLSGGYFVLQGYFQDIVKTPYMEGVESSLLPGGLSMYCCFTAVC